MRVFYLLIAVILFLTGQAPAQELKIAYDKNYEPYSYQDEDGRPRGAIIDIYKLWTDKAEYKVEFVPCEGKACLGLVLNGEVDILGGTGLVVDNTALDTVVPILRLSTSLFIRNDLIPQGLSEFEGSIYAIAGTPITKMDNDNYPELNIKSVASHLELKQLVTNESIGAFVFEMPDPVDPQLKMKIPDGYTRYQHLSSTEIRPVVLAGRRELVRSLIDEGHKITVTELADIALKNNLDIKTEANYSFLYASVVLFLAFVVVFLLVRNKRLTSRPASLTDEETDWAAIIAEGEHDKVEFKSSFRWDYRQEKPNKALEAVIMKTIAAFLNAEGGRLFIGVDDYGKVLGLENDYNSLSKANRDGFMLAMTNLINKSFGKDVHRIINIIIVEINRQDVCAISVLPSEKPVFLGLKGDEEFFVRASASSQPLSMSEALAYIKEHWSES